MGYPSRDARGVGIPRRSDSRDRQRPFAESGSRIRCPVWDARNRLVPVAGLVGRTTECSGRARPAAWVGPRGRSDDRRTDMGAWTPQAEPTSTGAGTLTMVEGSSFCICLPTGDLGGIEPHGVFFRDTRILSRWDLRIDGEIPEPLAAMTPDPYPGTFVARLPRRAGRTDTNLLVERHRRVGTACGTTSSSGTTGRSPRPARSRSPSTRTSPTSSRSRSAGSRRAVSVASSGRVSDWCSPSTGVTTTVVPSSSPPAALSTRARRLGLAPEASGTTSSSLPGGCASGRAAHADLVARPSACLPIPDPQSRRV